jgi:hypothetical protein
VSFELLGRIYALLKANIETGLGNIPSDQFDLATETEVEKLINCRSLLEQTMFHMIIEYVNQDGKLSASEAIHNWLMR